MTEAPPAGGGPLTIAYLTSLYARASDTFIRGEVAQLRALGHTVHTFSVRRCDPSELVDDDIRREHDSTEYLREAGLPRMGLALARRLVRSPRRVLAALGLAARTGTPGLKGRLWPLAYLFQAAYLAERLEARGVGHLHNHIGENSASVAMLASALSGVPFSLTVHGPGEFDRPTLLALGEKVRRAAFTAAVSEYGRSQLYRWSDPSDWPRVHVVRCGLDGRFLGQDPVPVPEARRLVCVGRLAEQKGQLLLVEAAGRLAAEGLDFELVLVGDGPLRAAIEGRVRDLGLGDRVRLAGWLSAEGVRGELLRSRALVLPSFAEGLPVVLMEALALGRPAVSTYVAGIPELVEPGVSGWLVPAGAVGPLAVAMREALTAPAAELSRMGRAGASRAAERHDLRREVARLDALFRGRGGVHRPTLPDGRPAVFLDRDGTLIEHVHDLSDPAEVRLLPGVTGALRRLQRAGFACVVVTNQPAVGRGRITEAQVREVHDEMGRQLAAEGAAVDAVYFCPEAPAGSDPTVVEHVDRKPGPGMLLRAAGDLGLDLGASWMVGDTVRDVLAGVNARCLGSVLVRTGKGPGAVEPGPGISYHTTDDLAAAADLILRARTPAARPAGHPGPAILERTHAC
jgi:histidinol-phosphate phosphatase family protein